MFIDTKRPVYFDFAEMQHSNEAGYSDIPWLHSIEGLGDLPASTILTTKTTLGEQAIGRSITNRQLVVNLVFPPGWNPRNFRRQLYDYWNFDLYAVHTYRIEYGGHQYIERYIDGIIESITPDIFAAIPSMKITIVCPNPNYYLKPYAPVLLDNGVPPKDENGDDILDAPLEPRTHTFNTTIETGFEIQITPQVGGTYTDISVVCDTGASYNCVQSFRWPNAKMVNSPWPGAKYIQGGDVIDIDTTPGSLRITLMRDGAKYNLLPFTKMSGGVMRVIPTTNVYKLQLLPLGLPGLVGTATCRELYLGV
jgi:hypothetical protein